MGSPGTSDVGDQDRRMLEALRRAGDVLLASRDTRRVLQNIVDAALVAAPAVRWAGVNRRFGEDGRHLGPVAATDHGLAELARRQDELDQGACVDTQRGETIVAADADEIARRWPAMAPHYAALGVASLASFPLFGPRRTPGGSLGLYADEPGVFDERTRITGELFAGQAAAALLGADRAAGLERALETRDAIGQAKGILMERHRVDADAAFALLVRTSQEVNMKLADVATWVATTRAGAGDPAAGPTVTG